MKNRALGLPGAGSHIPRPVSRISLSGHLSLSKHLLLSSLAAVAATIAVRLLSSGVCTCKSTTMLLSSIGPLALLFGLSAAGIYPPDVVEKLAEDGMVKLKEYMSMNPANGGCTLETAVKRKEWFVGSSHVHTTVLSQVLKLTISPGATCPSKSARTTSKLFYVCSQGLPRLQQEHQEPRAASMIMLSSISSRHLLSMDLSVLPVSSSPLLMETVAKLTALADLFPTLASILCLALRECPPRGVWL